MHQIRECDQKRLEQLAVMGQKGLCFVGLGLEFVPARLLSRLLQHVTALTMALQEKTGCSFRVHATSLAGLL